MALSKEVEERWSRMLEDPVPKVQMEALTQIGRSYFRAPEGTLAEISLGGPVRTGGTEERTLPRTLRDKIIEKLRSEDPDMRAEAVLALVHCQDEETADAILKILKDPESTVRLAAIQALAAMRQLQVTQDLFEVAESDLDELVRAHALATIEEMAEERTDKTLASAVRTRGGTIAPNPLARLDKISRSDPSSYVSFMARRARKRFTG